MAVVGRMLYMHRSGVVMRFREVLDGLGSPATRIGCTCMSHLVTNLASLARASSMHSQMIANQARETKRVPGTVVAIRGVGRGGVRR